MFTDVNEEEEESVNEDNGVSVFDDNWNEEVDYVSGNTQMHKPLLFWKMIFQVRQ